MRPIYNTQKNDTAIVTQLLQNKINNSEEIYETIDDIAINKSASNKFQQWQKKECKDKTTNYSPQTENNSVESVEPFYLSRNELNRKTSKVIENSDKMNSTNKTPDNNNSSASSFALSNIDTTPLFSPSQIMKLNRQRKQKKSEENITTEPELSSLYQKLTHTKTNMNYDLNNNEEISIEENIMSKPNELTGSKIFTEPLIEKSQIEEEKKEVDQEAKTAKTEISSSTTVFTYKKSIEKNEPLLSDLNQPVPTAPVPQKKTQNESTSQQNSPIKVKQLNNSFNKESYASESIYSSQYRSTISPRHTVVSRRSNNNSLINNSNNNYERSYNSMGHSTVSFSDSPISLRPVGSSQTLKENRQKEKQQLGELNDRFAGYVERVRFLEAQNKKLTIELSTLKSKWGSETKQIEQMYKIELDEARAVLNDTAKTKDCVQLMVNKQEAELDTVKRKYLEVETIMNKEKQRVVYLQEQISANESEISLLKRRLQDYQDEEKRYKQEATRMVGEIQRVSFELETEMKSRLMLENDKQSLEEELVFLKEIHAKEIEELKHLQFQQQGIDPAIFFKNELSNAIREIREEYESLNQSQRSELEGWYRIKISEIQRKNANKALTYADNINTEQIKRLKQQIFDSKRDSNEMKSRNTDLELKIKHLEDEIKREIREGSENISVKDNELNTLKQTLKSITAEYEDLMLSKTDLESEIRTYRKLLEGEEEKDGLKQIVEGIERRANDMSINRTNSMNRSYTVDTGYSSGAYKYKNTRKSLNQINNNQSFDSCISSFNQTIPTHLYKNLTQRFETNSHQTFRNSAKNTVKQFSLSNPLHSTSVNYSFNNSVANKSNSFLDNSSVSNISESSHYSALFSR